MSAEMRRELPGSFRALALSADVWRLVGEPLRAEVFVRGLDAASSAELARGPIADVHIEWRDVSVALCVTLAGRRRELTARSVIVHEPLDALYRDLPLAQADATSRRFWDRVFRIARWPGGRLLIAALARRARRRG
jgi:hypothetical protein